MLPENIVAILEKYKENNESIVEVINENIINILNQLDTLKDNLSKQIGALYSKNISDFRVDELHDDIKILMSYINLQNIQYATENFRNEVNDNNENDTFDYDSELQALFENQVRVFVLPDTMCPECRYDLIPYDINYCHQTDNCIIKKRINWYECPTCKKLCTLEEQANEFDTTDTNIIFDRKYYVPKIDVYSVIILSNTLHCSLNHKTRDILAKLPTINKQGELEYTEVSASYCQECNRFTILKEDYNAINGVIICKIQDETSEYKNSDTDTIEIAHRRSILANYGYNVQTKADLSEKQRHIILSTIIEANIMNRRDIINHIKGQIDRGSKIPIYKRAVSKWKADREYVTNYKQNDLPEIIFNEVILKNSSKSNT